MNNYTNKQIEEFNKGQAKETRQAIGIVVKYVFLAFITIVIFSGVTWAYSLFARKYPLTGLALIGVFTIVSIFVLMFLKSINVLK